MSYLVKVKQDAIFPNIDCNTELSEPLYKGSIKEYIEVNNSDATLLKQLSNKVKKCSSCSKPNA